MFVCPCVSVLRYPLSGDELTPRPKESYPLSTKDSETQKRASEKVDRFF
jgi:hypothetical protein